MRPACVGTRANRSPARRRPQPTPRRLAASHPTIAQESSKALQASAWAKQMNQARTRRGTAMGGDARRRWPRARAAARRDTPTAPARPLFVRLPRSRTPWPRCPRFACTLGAVWSSTWSPTGRPTWTSPWATPYSSSARHGGGELVVGWGFRRWQTEGWAGAARRRPTLPRTPSPYAPAVKHGGRLQHGLGLGRWRQETGAGGPRYARREGGRPAGGLVPPAPEPLAPHPTMPSYPPAHYYPFRRPVCGGV